MAAIRDSMSDAQREYVLRFAEDVNRYADALRLERATVAALRSRIKQVERSGSMMCCDCTHCPWCGGRWDESAQKMRHEEDCEAFTLEGEVK